MMRTNMYPIQCFSCGLQFNAKRVTASLKCARCQSGDIDLFDGVKEASSGGTGWNQPRPNPLEGWAVMPATDLPGPNPRPTDSVSPQLSGGTTVCPACKGSGYDNRASGAGYDEIKCRNCHGTGRYTPPTGAPSVQQNDHAAKPPVGSAAWTASRNVPVTITYADGRTMQVTGTFTEAGRKSSDPLGSPEEYLRGTYKDPGSPTYKAPQKPTHGETRALALPGASCPSCHSDTTQLVRDANDDAWWHCPTCGPLANIDRNPEVNPFHFDGTLPSNRKMKAASKVKTGTLFRKVQAVIKTNPGLTVQESLTLARASTKYSRGDR